jgi:hypothetical protein
VGLRGEMRQSTYPNRSVIVLGRRTLEQRDKFRVAVKVNPDTDYARLILRNGLGERGDPNKAWRA